MTISLDAQTNALIIPTAAGNVPLQVVRGSGARQAVTSSASSKVIPLPAGLEGMEISAVEDVYINFGIDDTVVASSTIASDGSRLFLAGVQVVPVPINPATGLPYTFMAVIRKSTDGIFQVESSSVNVPFPELPPPPPPSDPDFASVSLLLDMDGADGSTIFVDLSSVGNTVTVINEAAVDTAQKKFGTGSLLTDGANDGLKVVLDGSPNSHVPFDVQAGDFTVECHLRANTSVGGDQLFDTGPNGNRSIGILVSNDSLFMEYSVAGGSMTQVDSGHDISDATWHHIAMVRNGNDLDIFMDGVKGSITADVTGLTFHALDSSANIFIGIDDAESGGTDGWIDNFRFTKGVARYTTNFTPPTEFYPTS